MLPSKGKVHPRTSHEAPTGGVEVQLYSFLNIGARWKWVVNGTPRPFYPQGRDPVPIVQEAGWTSGRVRKISPLPEFDPQTVQTLASSYTNCAIPARMLYIACSFSIVVLEMI